jgi:hypothetical protein
MAAISTPALQQTYLGTDGAGGQSVVAGHHRDLDPGAVALRDRCRHLGSRRVEKTHDPDVGHVALEVLAAGGLALIQVADGEGERPVAARGEIGVELVQPLAQCFVHRHGPASHKRLRAQADDDVGPALHVGDAPPVALVDRGHSLALRVEGDL